MSDTVRLTCIECPTGCALTVLVEEGKAVSVEGYGCRRGRDYAIAEVDCPVRILTSTVAAQGLSVRMVPVRSSQPIPRGCLMDAMNAIRALTIDRPVRAGDVLVEDILGLGADIVATRDVERD